MPRELKNTAVYTAFDEDEPFDPAEPEKNLLRAVLLTALADLKRPGEPSRRAMEYLLNPEDDYLFSFTSVCNFLNVDPESILIVAGLKHSRMRISGLNLGQLFEI
jgi:hypothetical protein